MDLPRSSPEFGGDIGAQPMGIASSGIDIHVVINLVKFSHAFGSVSLFLGIF